MSFADLLLPNSTKSLTAGGVENLPLNSDFNQKRTEVFTTKIQPVEFVEWAFLTAVLNISK
jgi:hypothetical protein